MRFQFVRNKPGRPASLFVTKLGSGAIKGTTKKLNQPISNVRVRLYERNNGNKLHLGDTSSDKNGSYMFLNLPNDRDFYVVGIDPAKKYNAVIADGVRAK